MIRIIWPLNLYLDYHYLFFLQKKPTALIWQDFFFSSCFLLEFFFFTKTFLTLAQHQSIKNSQQNRTGFRKQFLVQILLTRAECVTMYPYNIGLPPSFSSLSKDTQWKICFAKMFKFLKFRSCSLDFNAILDQNLISKNDDWYLKSLYIGVIQCLHRQNLVLFWPPTHHSIDNLYPKHRQKCLHKDWIPSKNAKDYHEI